MRKLVIGTWMLVVMLVVSTHVSRAGAGNEFYQYENPAYNFQIAYPASWRCVEGFMGTAVIFTSPLAYANDQFSENVNIVVEDISAYPGITLEQYEEISLNQLAALMTGFNLVGQSDTVVSGFPAKVIEYECQQGIYQLKYMQVFVLASNRAYVFTFTAEESQFAHYANIAKAMLGSFTFN